MTNPKQIGFFDQLHPIKADIRIREDHELLRLTKLIPWPEQIEIAMNIRASKVKALVGPEPHYRELLGAVALMSVRQITYRQTEDLIAQVEGVIGNLKSKKYGFNKPNVKSTVAMEIPVIVIWSFATQNFIFKFRHINSPYQTIAT